MKQISSTAESNNSSYLVKEETAEKLTVYARIEHIAPEIFFRRVLDIGVQHYEKTGDY
ncbi:MAG TPA: hypothetical protein O0W95_05315 [Methanocorpusculum sp.]|nr:hypothetical protein [Methanocorpusculum sp.]